MIKRLLSGAMESLIDKIGGSRSNPRQRYPLPVEVRTHLANEANAIDNTLRDLGVLAWVSDDDIVVSSTGGFIRYRIECGAGVRISSVRAVTADLEIAINDCRRKLPEAAQVRIGWRNGHSFDLPYPFERNTLRWSDIPDTETLRPYQMIAGRNYETEQPSTMSFGFGKGRDTHLFVGGGTGSGKSVLISSLIASLCLGTPPSRLQILILDPKRDENLIIAGGFPHVALYQKPDDCVAVLQRLYAELLNRQSGGDNSTMLVIVLEEISLLMNRIGGKDAIMAVLNAMAGTARSANIHLIACTQYPNKKILDREFMVNFDVKVCGRFAGMQPMRQVLDLEEFTGAILPGNGSFYVNRNETVARIQTPLITPDDLQGMVQQTIERYGAVAPYTLPSVASSDDSGEDCADDDDGSTIDDLLQMFSGGDLPGIHKIREAHKDLFGVGIGTDRAREIQTMIAAAR